MKIYAKYAFLSILTRVVYIIIFHVMEPTYNFNDGAKGDCRKYEECSP